MIDKSGLGNGTWLMAEPQDALYDFNQQQDELAVGFFWLVVDLQAQLSSLKLTANG